MRWAPETWSRIRRAACDAGIAAARSGAHTRAAEFFTIALDQGGPLAAEDEAELLELLAGEFYLIDRLDDAICGLPARDADPTGARRGRPRSALITTRWPSTSGTTPTARSPKASAAEAMTVLDAESDDAEQLVQLGHAFAMQAYPGVAGKRS